MRRKKTPTSKEELDRDLLRHIEGLGLSSIEDYQAWCTRNGFSRKLNKHWKQLSRERYLSQESKAKERLKQKKREQRNQIDVLFAICRGELSESDVTLPHLKRLCKAMRTNGTPPHARRVDRKALMRLLRHLDECRAKFFRSTSAKTLPGEQAGHTYIDAIVRSASHSDSWQRAVEEWKPRSHSPSRQFASLLRHLFAKHDDVPLFLDAVWFAGQNAEAEERREWYVHIGRGKNIRTCNLPIPLTKKMAHHFMRAPRDVTIAEALRWGQVHGLGGDELLARAIFGTRLTESFKHDDFWSTVIRWFVANPMLDRSHVGPIVDYLHYQRFVPEQNYTAPGVRQEGVPPQPRLSMKGRTPEGVLRRVNEWHRKLANNNRYQVRQWQSIGIEGFEYLEGSEKNRSLKCWTIRELLSSNALQTEGRQMKHCVATYAASCARGHCSIWTMEVESQMGVSKAVTIEVRNSARLICQVRGKANRLATEKERRIIQRWAEVAGLRVASYV